MAHRVLGKLSLLLLATTMLLGPVLSSRALAGDKVTLTITAEGLPSFVQVKVFVNGTQLEGMLSSANPIVLRVDRGTMVSVTAEERVEGQFGFLYIRKSITLAGQNEPVLSLALTSDMNLVVRFETSHILLQPIFWPLYGIVIATTVLIAVRRRARREGTKQEATSRKEPQPPATQ